MADSNVTDGMKVTVILCTYNRCQSLARALESIALSAVPDSIQWEVLVVDNNSTDRTRETVEDVSQRYPGRFRYLFEAKQGLSNARNAGIFGSRGDLVAFTDDDVIVQPTWLQNLIAHLQRGDWAGAGGRVLLDNSFSCPKWLSLEEKHALAPLAIFDHQSDSCELTETPFGANMAFRREVFERFGGFRVDLGRCGNGMLGNEDTEFGRRLFAAGERLRYEASAVIYHPVPENRLQKQYFLTWWFDKGRSDARELGVENGHEWHVAGVPLYRLRRLAMSTLRWTISVHQPKRFSNKLMAYWNAGIVRECYKLAHRT